MKTKNSLVSLVFLYLIGNLCFVKAQIPSNVYVASEMKSGVTHINEIKVHDGYFVHTVYEKNPAKFIKTVGGFFSAENDTIHVQLEFNSNFAKDSISELSIPYSLQENKLVFQTESPITFRAAETLKQDLDGPWLFGTRGPDTGQKRRGDSSTRKTLKFLLNGRFQWIAYDIKGKQFKGTGGGSYAAFDGKYTEHIEFFSRDNARVGASLEFKYEIKENDWHHTGKNSKGAPMYTKRS